MITPPPPPAAGSGGLLTGVLGFKDIFALSAVTAGLAVVLLAALRNRHAPRYVGRRLAEDGDRGPRGFVFLFRAENSAFNASLIAPLGNKIG